MAQPTLSTIQYKWIGRQADLDAARTLADAFHLHPLVALATVADQVPLVGENRVLVKEGLGRLNHQPNLGLEALIAVAGLAEKRVISTAAVFQLALRVNAVGRLAHAKRAVELFLTEDPQEALSIARELNVYNDRRKALQSQVETEALAQIEAHPNWLEKKGLVDDLAKLEPFGNRNPEPVFFVAGVTVEAAQTMGEENQHLKVWARNEQGFTYPVLAFDKGEQRHAWQAGALHHLLVTVGDHWWKGERTIQMRMVDGR